MFEDTLAFQYHFLSFASFTRVNAPLYGYVSRAGSITKSEHPREEKVRNHDEAIQSFRQGLACVEDVDPLAVSFRTSLEYCRLYRLASRVTPRTPYVRTMMAEAREYVRGAWPGLRRDPNVGRGDKLRFAVLARTPGLYDPLMRLYERFVKGMK